MVGIGDPKEAQSNRAGLFEMTWYTLLGGVSTRGGSAVRKSKNIFYEEKKWTETRKQSTFLNRKGLFNRLTDILKQHWFVSCIYLQATSKNDITFIINKKCPEKPHKNIWLANVTIFCQKSF